MLSVGTGSSHNTDSFAAAVEATELALKHVANAPSALLVFARSTYDQHAIIQGVRSVEEQAPIVGGTTAGEITPREATPEASVVVVAISAPSGALAHAAVELGSSGAFEKGEELGELLQAELGEPPAALLMMTDGLSQHTASLVRGLRSELGSDVQIFGAGTADEAAFRETHQLFNNLPLKQAAVALAFSGAVSVAGASAHGWNPVGLPRKVTSADGMTVREIDGTPALAFYQEYLGASFQEEIDEDEHLANVAMTYPIGYRTAPEEPYILRTPLFLEEDGSVVFAGEVPEGAEVRLMIGGKEEAHAAARHAAEEALGVLRAPALALVFASHIRPLVYGRSEAARAEINDSSDLIGSAVPLAGFYGYHELVTRAQGDQDAITTVENGAFLVLLLR
ncbi:hypothetical protein GVX82_04160 [Patescibacteria group bacterium]|jgi:hypothetical protein|nr:hypothetical protein [Patescibacteria group bacterium]